jgi:glycosyltransferase involved in cell wall biosynthesis
MPGDEELFAGMTRPTLHLPAVPHTVTRPEWSQCAFTGKVLRFSPMMRAQGYDVIHYGVEGSESGATLQVDVMTAAQQASLLGGQQQDPRAGSQHMAPDDPIKIAMYTTFNRLLRPLLLKYANPGDIVCLPFGLAHKDAVSPPLPGLAAVETGIGYHWAVLPFFRVFESYAWMHFCYGQGLGATGRYVASDYNWVIPNYYDLADWPVRRRGRGDYVLYFGRIIPEKGLDIVKAVANERPDLRFVLCGRGDPTPWVGRNVEYLPPALGRERAAVLAGATALMMPSRGVEPFGGSGVEAQLVGTPVLAPDCGAFVETIEHAVSGYRCRTLTDWLDGLDRAPRLDRKQIARRAARLYSLEACGPRYARVFEQVADSGISWGTPQSRAPVATYGVI